MPRLLPEAELTSGERLLLVEAFLLDWLPDPPAERLTCDGNKAFSAFVVAAMPYTTLNRGPDPEVWHWLRIAKMITHSSRGFHPEDWNNQMVSRTPRAIEFLNGLPPRVSEMIATARGYTSVLERMAWAAR